MAKEDPYWDDSLMPQDAPEALGEIELTEAHLSYGEKRWPDASDSMRRYRVRQVIWVRLQHQQPHPDDPNRKLLGGPQPNSGRKTANKEIGRALVEAAQSRQKEVVDAAFSALDPREDASLRHKAAMNLAKHERDMAKEEREADLYARMTDAEVRRGFAEMLADMVRNGDLSIEDIGDIIDGTAEEIQPAGEIEQAA